MKTQADRKPEEGKPRLYVNGIAYEILAEDANGLLTIARPNGIKIYRARRLPDHPLYGECRGRIDLLETARESSRG